MNRWPPPDFADFASARVGSLYRTAVLLTHDQHQAEALLTHALGHLSVRWRRVSAAAEAEARRVLVMEYLARRRGQGRGWVDSDDLRPGLTAWDRGAAYQHAASPRPVLGDPLAGLSRRGRAWTVLRSVHGYSISDSAEVLRMSSRRGRREEVRCLDAVSAVSMSAVSMSALHPVLSSVADSFPPPDSHALLAEIGQSGRGSRRRRTTRVALAAIVVVGAVGAAATLLTEQDERAEVVSAAVPDHDYDAGFGLIDGRPRPFVDGLRLEKVEVIDYSLSQKSVSAPQLDSGAPLYAVAYCDLPGNAMDIDAVVDAIAVEPRGAAGEVIDAVAEQPEGGSAVDDPDAPRAVELSCVDRSADTTHAPVISALPGGVEDFMVTVPSVWSGTGALYLAFYSEAPWSRYPFSPIPEDADAPPEPESGEVIEPADSPTEEVLLEELLDGQPAQVRSMDVDINTALDLTLRTSEPGQLLVAIDGVVVTNDGEELTGLGRSRPGPWSTADPALRHGFWRGYSASGYHRRFDSGTLSRMGVDITDDTVRVSVIERGFNGDGWQVVVTTDGGEGPMPLAPGYADSLPEYAHGLRRVATFQVPADGQPHQVPMSAGRAEALTWVGACDIETPRGVRGVTLMTPERIGLIACASSRNEWAAPLMPLADDAPGGWARSGAGSDSAPTLKAPRTSEPTSMTVGAYAAVSYEDFPFETRGVPSTTPLDLRPVPDEGDLLGRSWASDRLTAWTEVDALSDVQLDSHGRGTLSASTDRPSLVTVSTRGRGRFMIRVAGDDRPVLDARFYDPSILGRVASPLMYRDGWWTSWTTEPMHWAIPLRREATSSTLDLHVTAEGYEPGSLEVRVLQGEGVEANR